MVKKTLLCLLTFTLASTTMVLAAQKKLVAVHTNHLIVRKAVVEPSNGPTICSNLGPASNEYFAGNGWLVAGPASALGTSQFIAQPCTPAKNYTLTTVKAPWQWAGQGSNRIQICLFNDNGSNAPGTQIGNCVTKRNLPAFGTTNTLVTANFTTQGLALTGGTQYWIVAQTPLTGPGSDAYDTWNFEGPFQGDNIGGNGWGSFQPESAAGETVMKVSGF